MNVDEQHEGPAPGGLPGEGPETPPGSAKTGDEAAARPSRRDFLGKTARRLAYVAPVVLLFKPRQAVAASQGGSLITP